MTEAIENHLEYFRVRPELPLFYISTSSGRVSFIAQQWRALNLAFNMGEIYCGDLREHMDIAIVGGGVAGVTALVALHGLGFKKARLYEAQSELFGTHLSCEHRHSHPSANYWPFSPERTREGCPATTRLPFLNWHVGSVSDVVRQMQSDENLSALHEFVFLEKILEIVGVDYKGKGAPKITLGFKHSISDEKDESISFGAVILANGFGREKNLNSSISGSYWWSDHVKHYRGEHQHYRDANVYISGTGDGALIDFYRFLLKAGNEPDRSEENLAAAFMGELRPPKFSYLDAGSREATSSTESDLQELYETKFESQLEFQTSLHGFAQSRTAKNPDGVAAHEDWSGALELLEEKFKRNRTQLKFVVPQDNPDAALPVLRPEASPINALLTACLMSGKATQYVVPGKVNEKEQKLELNNESYDATKDLHVARNGTMHGLAKIFSQSKLNWDYVERERLAVQEVRKAVGPGKAHLADHIILQESLKPENYPYLTSKLDTKKRFELATTFFQNVLHCAHNIRIDLNESDDEAPDCVVTVPEAETAEKNLRLVGGVERDTFGLNTRYEVGSLIGDDEPQIVNNND